ncbi:MAG: sigma-70 family RNA polymerase sigma factor [Nitriliruptorales bacterium]|nr:sigma-70 family RNA polymerase sigma factor [Nitriliruptorales bacterium]
MDDEAAGPATAQRLSAKDGFTELMQRGASRGYVLLSELDDLHDALTDPEGWLDDAAQFARDAGMQVVDDLSDDEDPPPASPLSLSTDSVRQYLNAIGRVDLLTPEEEVDLAKRDQAGRAAREFLDAGDDLSTRRSAQLRRISRDGLRAQERMVCANLRLVVSVSRRYLGRGLSLLELIQEGNLGLIRGVEKFDHTKGYKFSTYATWWIRQALTRGTANKSRAVRLPVHVHELVSKIRRTELELCQRLGRDPKEEEIAEALAMEIERVRELRLVGRDIASLDRPVGEEGDTTVGDLVPDDEAADPEASAAYVLTRLEVTEALAELEDRERDVVMMRFGLSDGECHTLEEIGDKHGVTRERIRQIEKKVLAKLRHPSRARKLEGLIETAAAEAVEL